MMFKQTLVAAAMLGASSVNAHLTMSNPVPYGKDSLNNSPLAADGSDFPCKQRSGVYDVTEENTIKIGEVHPLTLVGSATHGGGSCQISLTTDLKPTKDTEWMVIKSFEGGCPINTEGNLSNGASSVVPSDLNFTIPSDVEAGKYTLAWTWFNRVGNREMYMNCAPVTVTDGSSSKREAVEQREVPQKRSSSYPPMFVANVNGCTTKEEYDIRFPNPGEVVEYDGDASNLLPSGTPACSGTPTFGGQGMSSGASGSNQSPSATAGDSGSGATATVSVGLSLGLGGGSQATGAPGIFAGGASSSAADAAPSPTEAAAPAESSSSTESSGFSDSGSSSGSSDSGSSAGSSDSGSSSTTSSSGALSGSCSNEGEWNCIGGSSFQRCASGKWTDAQQMAAGTKCNSGQAKELSISASASLKPRFINEMRSRRRAHGGHHHA